MRRPSPKLLILGAGGTVGRPLASLLADERPRLAFHDAGKAERARGAGHDVVLVDYAAPATLTAAMRGIERLFLLDAGSPQQTERELAAVHAARAAGVEQIVKLSVWDAETERYGIARIHRAVEKAIEDSGMRFTFLRPNGFMQNFVTHMASSIRERGAFFLPAAEAKVSHVDVRDVAAVAAAAFTSPAHDGKAYALSGPTALGYHDAARALGEQIGRPVHYVPVSDDDARRALLAGGMPEPYAEAILDLHRYYRSGAGEPVSQAIPEVTGRPAISFATFAREHAEALR